MRAVATSLIVLALAVLLVWARPTITPAPAIPATSPTLGAQANAPATMPTVGNAAVYFSPRGGATAAVVREIDAARESIDVQAYSFTSTPIARAVKAAFDRGVKVRVILDKSQRTAQYSSATYLFNAGVPTFIDARHAIAHNKVILIDGTTIITGSMNFTAAGEDDNAENLLVMRDAPVLYASYADNFAAHLAHAEKYNGLP